MNQHGRGRLSDVLQDTYCFVDSALREVVFGFYEVCKVGQAIRARQARDTAKHLSLHPAAGAVPVAMEAGAWQSRTLPDGYPK